MQKLSLNFRGKVKKRLPPSTIAKKGKTCNKEWEFKSKAGPHLFFHRTHTVHRIGTIKVGLHRYGQDSI